MANSNFKKLAVMGMACGAILSQSLGASESKGNMNLAGHNSCGAGSCGQKSSGRGLTADATTDMKDGMAGRKLLTETELMNRLNDTGRATYNGLTPEGKALALRIASSDQFKDKNEAVREAARQVASKNGAARQGGY